MASRRAKGCKLCGDFLSRKMMAYSLHATDVGCLRISSYSNVSTSTIAASSRNSEGCRLGSHSTTAEGGWRVPATVGGILWLWLTSTLYTFMSNSFDFNSPNSSIPFKQPFVHAAFLHEVRRKFDQKPRPQGSKGSEGRNGKIQGIWKIKT